MSDDLLCPQCGADPYETLDVVSYGELVRRIPLWRCCPPPPPSPAQLRRRAEDGWLAWQRELASEAW